MKNKMIQIENTSENKAKFFAQYWGQEVLMAQNNNGGFSRYTAKDTEMHEHYLNHNCYLELKPLSQITDEEALYVAKEVYTTEYINKTEVEQLIKEGRNYCDFHFFRKPDRVDLFRFKGYALPWMGIPVEDQIEWGWVKLTDNLQPTTENRS